MTNIKDIISRHQKTAPSFNFEEKEREFKKLEELYNMNPKKKWEIVAIFINTKGKYGDQGVFVTDDYNVNLPQHLLELCEELRQDEDVVELINQRKIGFDIYEYQGKNGKGFSVNLQPINITDEKDDRKGFDKPNGPIEISDDDLPC